MSQTAAPASLPRSAPGPAGAGGNRRALAITFLAVFAFCAALQAWNYATQAEILFPDFFAFWSWAQAEAAGDLSRIYDPAWMQAFQRALDPRFGERLFPFTYPPTFLLFLWPLQFLGYIPARLVWAGGTLLLFLLAVFGRSWRPIPVLAALLCPATCVSLIYGQNGLLSAALMIAGLRTARSNPVLAGVLLGLLSYKPSLALLVPIALAAAGLWRTLAWAAATALPAAAASAAAFGPALWADWLTAGAAHWQALPSLETSHAGLLLTLRANLAALRLPAEYGAAAQAAAGLAAAAAVWRLWRRGQLGPVPIAAVPVGTLLATPYAFVYDLPLLAGAVLLLLAAEDDPASFSFAELLLLALALLLPQLMFTAPLHTGPLAPLVLALVLALLWRHRANTETQ